MGYFEISLAYILIINKYTHTHTHARARAHTRLYMYNIYIVIVIVIVIVTLILILNYFTPACKCVPPQKIAILWYIQCCNAAKPSHFGVVLLF